MKHSLKSIIILSAAVVTIILGVYVFRQQHYTFISIIIASIACIGFFFSFERRELTTRYTVIIAVMTSLSIVGRLIFAPIPGFKPVTAIVIISGMYISPQSGFAVGVLTALISNMYFGHGAWTPFQMLSWGVIGLLAGSISNILKKNRVFLAFFGFLCGILYSLIMDIWTVLWYSDGNFNFALYSAAIISAIPYTVTYAVSNVIFLLLLGNPIGKKLNRANILIQR